MNMHDHLKRYPNARPSTLAYIQLREAKTEQLRKEVADMSSRPRSETAVRRMMRGIASFMDRVRNAH